MPGRFTICCVIDQQPRFYVELVLWILCANRYLPATRFRPVVYFVGRIPDDILAWLQARETETRTVEPLIAGSPHCNKIIPLFDNHDGLFTIITDSDLYFVGDPSFYFNNPRFRAPPNNHCNPPASIFKAILAASGLNRPYRAGMALYKGHDGMRETHVNNISAGLVAAPSWRSTELGNIWRKWALWLVANCSLLDRWSAHVDQVAFALAMEELGEDVEFLPPQTNTVLHSIEEIATVYAFHLTTGHIPAFAARFNADRTLKIHGLAEGVVSAIERLNSCIDEAMTILPTLPSTRDHLDKFLNPAWER